MAFPLSKIELHIDDSVIVQAEQFLEGEGLSDIVETETGLWVASAQEENEIYETEVLIKKGKVNAHTCECGNSDSKRYCIHAVSLLLELLKRQKSKTEKKKKVKPPTIPKRITIPYILDLVSSEDLKSFIKEYASQERHFGLLLKAQFAHLLPRTGDNEPINQTLSNILAALKKPGKTVSKSDWKMIQKVLDTFLQQADEALYKKHYADVFEISEAILIQLSSMLLLTEERTVFINSIRQTLQVLRKLTQVDLAPELEKELWDFTLAEADNRVYYFYDLWQPLGELLLALSNTRERSARLLQVFGKKSEDQYVLKHPEISAGLVNFKIQLFELQHNDAALRRYLEENISHPEVLKQAISFAEKSEQWIQLAQLTKFALQSVQTSEESSLLKEKLLMAYQGMNKQNLVRQLSEELFLTTFEIKYFKLIKQSTGKQWPEQLDQLLQRLEALPYRIEKIRSIAEIFATENRLRELREHLAENLSLDLLKQYDHLLFQKDISQTEELYRTVVSDYLDNYVGRPAAVKVRESIAHILEQGYDQTAQSIIAFLNKKYADRKSLMEELANNLN